MRGSRRETTEFGRGLRPRFCVACGQAVEPEQAFCVSCGHRLEPLSMPAAAGRRKPSGLLVALVVIVVTTTLGVVGAWAARTVPFSGTPATADAQRAFTTPEGSESPGSTPPPEPSAHPSATRSSPGAAEQKAPAVVPSLVDEESAALDRLTQRAEIDGKRVEKRGQWMAQLASKYVGINDPLQVTASGSHTFTAADIWEEYETVRSRVGSSADVVLLDSRTYGKRRSHDGEALWVVAALSSQFVDEDSVENWCAQLYPALSGEALSNVCMPNLLRP